MDTVDIGSELNNSDPRLPDRPWWTPRRIELKNWLGSKAPSLAELYEGAVTMVYDHAVPGRIKFIAHAIREIGNRLPDYIAGEESVRRSQHVNRLEEIAPLWNDHQSRISTSPTIPKTTETPSDPIPIPADLYWKLAGLIEEHVLTSQKPLAKARRLFDALDPEGHRTSEGIRLALLEYVRIVKWSVGKCHDSGKIDANHNWKEFVHTFELFESCLSSIACAFYVTIESLDEILEDTNS